MEMKFDPNTGEPIQQNQENAETVVENAESVTEGVEVKKNKNVWIGVGVVAAIAVVAVAVIMLVMNLALGKNGKILKAAVKTMEPNHLMKDANFSKLIADGDFTLSVNGEVEDVELSVSLASDMSKQKHSIGGKVDVGSFDTTFAAMIDKKEIKAQVPDIYDTTFVYDYTDKKKDGYIVDLLDDEDVDIEDVDKMISAINSEGKTKSLEKDLTKTTKKLFNELEFKKVSKKSCKVNGKSRNCKGYETTIDEDYLKDCLEAYGDIYEKNAEDLGDTLDALDMDVDDISDLFDDMADEIDDMPDVEMTIYLYKGQIAEIDMEIEDVDVEIEFLGGDTPTQNMKITAGEGDYKTEIEIEGKVSGGVETYEVSVDDKTYLEYEYNYKKGNVELTVYNGYSDDEVFVLEGTLKSKSASIEFVVDKLEVYGKDIDVEGSVVIKDKAEFAKFEKTDETFDVGNASEDEWEDLIEDISESDDIRDLMNMF